MTALRITTVRKRPDLLPVVAEWLWRQWWEAEGFTLERTIALFAGCVAERGAPQTFILLEDERPVGTVTLAREDLDERPELTPWLAGVFIVPDRRGRGYVYHLFAEFERACRAASIELVWLYTSTAERIYWRAGWETVEIVERPGKDAVTLMRRVIPGSPLDMTEA